MNKLVFFLAFCFGISCQTLITKKDPKVVVVLDTGVDLNNSKIRDKMCKHVKSEDFTGKGLQDVHGHGTHVAGLIIENAGNTNYCLVIYKFYHKDDKDYTVNYSLALEKILDLSPDYLNYSGGGSNYDYFEWYVFKNLTKTKVIVAMGNNSSNIDEQPYFPASYPLPNIYRVASKKDGVLSSFSNYSNTMVTHYVNGENVKSYGLKEKEVSMSGTSMSTAIFSGQMIKKDLQ